MQSYFSKSYTFYRYLCSIIRPYTVCLIIVYILFLCYGITAYANDTDALSVSSQFVPQDNTIRIAMLTQDSGSSIPYTDNSLYQCSVPKVDRQIIEKVRMLLGKNIVCSINESASTSQELFTLLEDNTVDIVMYSKVSEEAVPYLALSSTAYVTMDSIAFVRYREGSIFSKIPRNENVVVHTVSVYEKLFKSNFDKNVIPVYTVEDVLDQLHSRYIYAAFLNEFDAHAIIRQNPQILMYYKPVLFKEKYLLQRNMYVNNSALLVIINSAIQSVGDVRIDDAVRQVQ